MSKENEIFDAAQVFYQKADERVRELTDAGEVDNAVIEALVKERMVRRTALLLRVVNDRKNKMRQLQVIKPYSAGYTEKGHAVPGTIYTRKQIDQIQSLKRQIQELDDMIVSRNFDRMSNYEKRVEQESEKINENCEASK